MDAFTAGRYCPPWMNCVGRSIPCACTTSMQLANLASYTCLLFICCYTLLRSTVLRTPALGSSSSLLAWPLHPLMNAGAGAGKGHAVGMGCQLR